MAAGRAERIPNVTVVGGGVTGLAVSYFISRLRPELEVALIESTDRLGGKILTRKFAGAYGEAGPDSLVARNGIITDLCADLGLSGSVIYPKTSRSYVWARGKLRPIPVGVFAGYPAGGLLPLARSGILSLRGILRVSLDAVMSRTRVEDDVSIGSIVESRFGSEFKTRLVDPLIGGLMSSDSEHLSAREVLPGLYSLATHNRSVLMAARRQSVKRNREEGSTPTAPFFSFRQGTSELISRLEAATGGVTKHTGERVEHISSGNGRWHLSSTSLELDSDALVLALPAGAASSVIEGTSRELSSLLSGIPYASVATVLLAYSASDFSPGIDGSGFLMPGHAGFLMTACSLLSSKWSNACSPGKAILRCFAGKHGDERWMGLDDAQLAERMHSELKRMGIVSGEPAEWVVNRWENALPVYEVGHRELVLKARSACPPGLYLAGAAYSGVGISSCVADAKQVAESVAARLPRTY